jgi:hypothetical protein
MSPSVANGSVSYSADALYMIREIMSTPYGKFTHIYTNQADFETMGKSNKVGEFDWSKISGYKQDEIPLTKSEIKTIVRYAVIVSFCGNKSPNWKEITRSYAISLLEKLGIEVGSNDIVRETIDKNISDIENYGGRFFQVQTNTLKKELEDIAPYKYRKYVSPIDGIAKKQVDEYERLTGKRISIFSIKFNLEK